RRAARRRKEVLLPVPVADERGGAERAVAEHERRIPARILVVEKEEAAFGRIESHGVVAVPVVVSPQGCPPGTGRPEPEHELRVARCVRVLEEEEARIRCVEADGVDAVAVEVPRNGDKALSAGSEAK